jgi:hypothetical protein
MPAAIPGCCARPQPVHAVGPDARVSVRQSLPSMPTMPTLAGGVVWQSCWLLTLNS